MDAHCALGFLRLAEGDARAADELLARGAALARRHGIGDPGVFVFAPDEIEAAVLVGDLDRAEGLLSDFEARARRTGRTWALGAGARTRALLLDARGARADALTAAVEALRHFDQQPYPFDRARARLVHGMLLRRVRRFAEARRSLEEAAAAFSELEARPWAERARAEAARLGGRPARTSTLTTTERQVVELVVAGKSNHEVARALHVSPKTVEWNLSKIYKKLRVSSRTELAAKLARSH
jgi:DNA-binding NarL/FixJ family response regulator